MKQRNYLTIAMAAFLIFSMIAVLDTASAEGEVHFQRLYGIVYEKSATRAAGEPVPGAEVYVEQEPNDEPWSHSNSTNTGDDGSYELIVPNGTFKITVKKAGYETGFFDVVVLAGKDQEKNLFLVKKGDALGVEITCEKPVKEMKPGETHTFRICVRNTGIKTDSYRVEISGEMKEWAGMGVPALTRSTGGGGPYSQSVSNLEDNGIADIDVNITVPEDAEPGEFDFTLRTTSTSDQKVEDELNITVKVVPDVQESDEDEETPGPGILVVSMSAVMVSLIALVRRSKRDH
ncbi:MAG: carboxypeptidase regulatory-like domain-containing protein [Thermoplasmatota archaeon]